MTYKATAEKLVSQFPQGIPKRTKHGRYPITYLVQGIPIDVRDIPKLEPNVIVEARCYGPS